MDTLIPHVDYMVADVDYDAFYRAMISTTFDDTNTRQHALALWNFMDYVFDTAVRRAEAGCLLGGLEHVYEAVEDFCEKEHITQIPELYKYIFDARGGFLTQSKLPLYMQKEWRELYHPLPCCDDDNNGTLQKFKDFVTSHKSGVYVMVWLRRCKTF